MRIPLLLFVFGIATVQGAISETLFSRGGGSFTGLCGNVVFNGEQFVTPVVETNGAMHLSFIDTNGMVVSNFSLAINGTAPRLILNGTNYLLAWIEPDSNAFLAAPITAAGLGTISVIEWNVAGSMAISAALDHILAVWQTAESPSAVFARRLNLTGGPIGTPFRVLLSTKAQAYPSAASDGTNHLVCWMEQNGAVDQCSGEHHWRVLAVTILAGMTGAEAKGALKSLSPRQLNRNECLQAYATACCYGTNFLVAWSASYTNYSCSEPLRPPTIHTRVAGTLPLGNEFVALGSPNYNTNAAIVFGAGRFFVGCANSESRHLIQPMTMDGTPQEGAIPAARAVVDAVGLGFGAGLLCAVYSHHAGDGYVRVFGQDWMPDPTISNLRRATNGGIKVESSANAFSVSLNLTNWDTWPKAGITNPAYTKDYSAMFVRAMNGKWRCIDQLRMVQWAKQRYALDYGSLRPTNYVVSDTDIFGTTLYIRSKPLCPENGEYQWNSFAEKSTCTIAGHTLD